MSLQPKDITDALRHVNMPGSNENIVDLDMVQEIRIEGKKVSFTLVFQKSNDPSVPIVKSLPSELGVATADVPQSILSFS